MDIGDGHDESAASSQSEEPPLNEAPDTLSDKATVYQGPNHEIPSQRAGQGQQQGTLNHGIGRKPPSKSRKRAFERLPEEIIIQILLTADPNVFASLRLLNQTWRDSAQQSKIYAHQLSRCPFFALQKDVTQDALVKDNLPKLQRIFNSEIKRNLFNAYLRPKETIIELISTSVSSSAAFPGGEALQFCFSSRGSIVLAISSSRIYVIDTTLETIKVIRELKIRRRPVSAAILDDGSFLAVLSTDHQVNLYDLRSTAKHTKTVQLDNPPRTIALAPGGSVLAAAYNGGIEVYSLSATAMSTDRRAVKCDAVDSLSFSVDGTMLLGTTRNSPTTNTVVLSAPYYHEGDEDVPPSELLSQMWTTQILFPNNSRDCSHATLLPQALEGDTGWTFTYDRVFETFRAVRVDDLRNGTMYFTGPFSAESDDEYSLPSTLPTANAKGEVVAAGFAGKEIWLYGIPEDLEMIPDPSPMNGVGSEVGSLSPSSSIRRDQKHEIPTPSTHNSLTPTGRENSNFRLPQWQVLCDKFKNVFIAGQHLASVDGISGMIWVKCQKGAEDGATTCDRLIAVAPGIVNPTSSVVDQSKSLPTDGGRIVIYDFERGTNNGTKEEITIELGDLVPEALEEERRDMEAEVAIVRRRTVAKNSNALGRSRETEPLPPLRNGPSSALPSVVRSAMPSTAASVRLATGRPPARYSREVPDLQLDAPFTPGDPRSRSLLRAATVASNAASSRNRRNMTGEGPGGHRDPPHESDADNWTPPPPPYTEDSSEPLPDHLLLTLLPSRTEPIQRVTPEPIPGPVRASTNLDRTAPNTIHRARTTAMARPTASFESQGNNPSSNRRSVFRRSVSNEAPLPTRPTHITNVPGASAPRNITPPSIESESVDLYEVTPPSSPVAIGTSGPNSNVSTPEQNRNQGAAAVRAPPRSDSINAGAISNNTQTPNHGTQSRPTESFVQQPRNALNAGFSNSSHGTQPQNQDLARHTSSQASDLTGPSTAPAHARNTSHTSSLQDESVPVNFSRVQPVDPVNLQSDPAAHLIPRKPTVVRPRRSSSLQNQQRPDPQLITSNQQQQATPTQPPSPARSMPSRANDNVQSHPTLPQTNAHQSAPSSNTPPVVTSASVVEPDNSHTPVAPSAEQMAALQSRYSSDQARPRPSSISRQPQNPQTFYNSNAQIAAYPYHGPLQQGVYPTSYNPPYTPSPPRAAAGAAGQPPKPTNSPSRSNSGRNSRTPPTSRSPAGNTPNASRPDLRRLDTIHSIRSQNSEQLISAVVNSATPTSPNQGLQPPHTRHGGEVYLSSSHSASDMKALAKANEAQQQQSKRPRWKLGRGKSEGSATASIKAGAPTSEESWEEVTRKWKVETAGEGTAKRKKKDRSGDGEKDAKCVVM